MKKFEIYVMVLTIAVVAGGSLVAGNGVRAAEHGYIDGDILATHSCPIYGYTLRVIRPAGSGSSGSNARKIQVDKARISFHTVWNHVDSLTDQVPVDDISVVEMPANPRADGQRYCTANGHLIPTDETVYRVSQRHGFDYNGNTEVFYDSDAEVATLNYLIAKYNNRPDGRGTDLPVSCPQMDCLPGSSGVSSGGSGGSGWPAPGTFTSADGEVHDLFDLCNPNFEICDEPSRPSVGRVEGLERASAATVIRNKPMGTDPVPMGDGERGRVTVVKCPYQQGGSLEHRCAKQCSGSNRSWDPDTWKCTVRSGVDPYNAFDRAEDRKRGGKPRPE